MIIAGPNGAGKTTISRAVLADTLGVLQFVNADAIASGLSGFTPEAAAFPAGRIMLARLRELVAARESFAFESTLASRTFAPWLRGCIEGGYWVTLVYVMLQPGGPGRRTRPPACAAGRAQCAGGRYQAEVPPIRSELSWPLPADRGRLASLRQLQA